jgi:hypothetical protein
MADQASVATTALDQDLLISPRSNGSSVREMDLGWAILATLGYSDLFDYPLRLGEIHRYLIGWRVTPHQLAETLSGDRRLAELVAVEQGYHFLSDRPGLASRRVQRARASAELWPQAAGYGRVIAGMPFVRMLAVTGALALDNSEPADDIDFLVVTEPGRLWLTRAMIVGLVRLAAQRGIELCPNFFISERALRLPDQSLFAAHELAQMVPLAGLATYQRMRRLNHNWASAYLPNAAGPPPQPNGPRPAGWPAAAWPARLAEAALRWRPADVLERWEMRRKMVRFSAAASWSASGEARFGPDWCKGHFDGHAHHTILAYTRRLKSLAEAWR